MKLRLRYFGHLSEIASEPVEVELEGIGKVGELRASLAQQHPEKASGLERCMVAINTEYVDDEAPVSEGDEIAFLPPVSGG